MINPDAIFHKAYGSVAINLILPLGDIVSRQRVMNYYSFFKKAQWCPREQLDDLQNGNLRETVRTAYEQTAFYRELYDKQRLKVSEIRTIRDLPKLPLVTKDMLRSAYPQKCTRVTQYAWSEYYTSGSTGKQFAIRIDNLSMSIARALMLVRSNFAGWEVGESYLQTGMSLDRGWVKRLKDLSLRVSYVSAFNLSDKQLDSYLDLIERRKLKYVMGYAASLYCIAKRAMEVGFNHILKGIISWGDNLFSHYRTLIERQFKCRVTDSYGCAEGIQVSAQCGFGDGHYHIFTPHVAVEFIRDGYPVSPGELGEIALTRLDPGAMPLIRYRIGDVGRESLAESCPCGRGFRLMKSVEGRDSDIILTPNGNRLIVHFFTGILEYADTIDTFQVVQESVDEILVKIVPRKDFKSEHWEKLKHLILEKGDPDLKIKTEIVNEIPLEKSNKRRFVISKIDK